MCVASVTLVIIEAESDSFAPDIATGSISERRLMRMTVLRSERLERLAYFGGGLRR
jgi:hypothetical protein